MDPSKVRVGGEYIWRAESGQTLRAVVTELPKPILTGLAPENIIWMCKVKLLDSPLARPDSSVFVSDLHEK